MQGVGREASGLNEDKRCRPVSHPRMPLRLVVNMLHFQMYMGENVSLGSTGLRDGVIELGLMPSTSYPLMCGAE